MPDPLPPPPDIPEGLEHLLPLFVAEMAKDAATLQELASAPLADLADHAHAMRGKAGLFGEQRLYVLLTRIEELALAGNAVPLDGLVALVVERSSQLAVYGAVPASG